MLPNNHSGGHRVAGTRIAVSDRTDTAREFPLTREEGLAKWELGGYAARRYWSRPRHWRWSPDARTPRARRAPPAREKRNPPPPGVRPPEPRGSFLPLTQHPSTPTDPTSPPLPPTPSNT